MRGFSLSRGVCWTVKAPDYPNTAACRSLGFSHALQNWLLEQTATNKNLKLVFSCSSYVCSAYEKCVFPECFEYALPLGFLRKPSCFRMHCKSQNAEQALWNQTLKQAEITLGRKYPSQGPEFAACTVVLVCIDSCVPDWLNRRSCFEKLLCALEKRWRLMGECGDGGGECTRNQGRWKLREANGS